MTNEKMTVHKALCELKVLEDRINSTYRGKSFVFANKHSNTKIKGVDISTVVAEAKSALASTMDLIARRDAIKRAVVLSNATATVTIGGKVYTVAEAIEMKNGGVLIRNAFFKYLSNDLAAAQNTARRYNDCLDDKADAYVKSLYDGADMKNIADDVRRTREEYIKSQTYEIVDAIGASDVLKNMEAEISAFMVDVDSALSVSNAVTEIEISY